MPPTSQARAAAHEPVGTPETILLILTTLNEDSLPKHQALSILEQTAERLLEPARMLARASLVRADHRGRRRTHP
jgi:hypothetical protein